MKIFRAGLCYVDKMDVKNIPNGLLSHRRTINGREYVVFSDRSGIEHFEDRKDIVNYDLLALLNEKELDDEITTAFNFTEFYYQKYEGDKKNKPSPEVKAKYFKKFETYRTKFYDLVDYKNNKSLIDHIVRIHMSGNLSAQTSIAYR